MLDNKIIDRGAIYTSFTQAVQHSPEKTCSFCLFKKAVLNTFYFLIKVYLSTSGLKLPPL